MGFFSGEETKILQPLEAQNEDLRVHDGLRSPRLYRARLNYGPQAGLVSFVPAIAMAILSGLAHLNISSFNGAPYRYRAGRTITAYGAQDVRYHRAQ